MTNRPGFTFVHVIVILIAIFVLGWLFSCGQQIGAFGSVGPTVPSSISIAGPATIPNGGSAVYTLTLTTNQNAAGNVTYTVAIEEADTWSFDEVLETVNVTVPQGQSSGTATFTLNCSATGDISGTVGSDSETPNYQIEPEFSRSAAWNLRGPILIVQCVPPEEEEEQ